jgi:hypothetical protein
MTLITRSLKNRKTMLVLLLIALTCAIRMSSAATSGGSATISIRFVAGGVPMGAAEVAGVVAKSNWNNANGNSGVLPLGLMDETGSVSGASVVWQSDNLHSFPILDQPGNVRMMSGYLDDHSGHTTTVSVNGLPANAAGYNIYVYADGDNRSASRTGVYQISGPGITTTSISLTDASNTNFSGTFIQANNSNGNYVVFNIKGSGFTVSAIPGPASDGTQRAPLNGMQIVPVGQSSTPDFTLSTTPNSSTVSNGSSANSTVSVGAINGFNGAINLSVSGLPAGATASLSPATVSPGASATLSVSASVSTPPGNSMLSITGAGASLTHTIILPLTVSSPGGTSGNAISIKFPGTGTPMAGSEVAGVVPKSNWNNESGSNGQSTSLVDETGTISGASVSWTAVGVYAVSIVDQPGNDRMMRGYLDTSNGTATTVSVSGLPANANGYSVYVYADGDNKAANRQGIYQISGSGITTKSISLLDAANTNFNGAFTQANNSAGNYVMFGINATAFTISATPSTASDGTQRAPLNGIQIVPVGSGTGGGVAPSITTQPASVTVTSGQIATFSVLASGTGPLTYQWQKNGAAISGATGTSYTTPATTTSDNGAKFVVVVRNAAGNATSNQATLVVSTDTTPPTVSITSPTSGSTISGTNTVTASASDNVAVASVQLQADGTNVGVPDTTPPYTFSLDTTALSNGAHSLSAVAVDTSGNQTTSAAVPITVSNQVGGGPAVPTYANNGSGCPINTVAGGPTDAVTSYTCPLPNPTGAGNLLVIFLRYLDTNPTVSFTDNIGSNTYSQAVACQDAPHGTQSRLYYVQNVAAGVNRVSVNFSSSTGRVQLGVYEFYNAATTAALDGAHCQVGSGTSISSGALPGLAASGDLVMHFGHADNSVAIGSCAVGSQANITWTMRSALISSNEPFCAQYGIYNSTASFSPAMTFNRSVSYISIAAAFKAASGGTQPPSGIRVAYVQHDDGGQEQNSSFAVQLPVSGNLIAELTSAGCSSNTISSCAYANSLSDGTNAYARVGPNYVSNTGSSQESAGSIWYAKNVSPGLYPVTISMNGRPGSTFPLSWIMYDIVGASSDPLDLGFGGAGNGLASISNTQATSTGGPLATFTATPSAQNEVILAEAGYEWNTFTGLTSPAGAQFLSAHYTGETNFSWCDLNGGWGLLYNGPSTAPVTWTWTHDASQFAGAGRGLALGVAFKPAN